jgi:SAM-dependent methyltransferase
MTIKYKCVSCGSALEVPASCAGVVACSNCRFSYEHAPKYLKYDFNPLLFRKYGKRYLLNKVLNNNAYLSYLFLKEGSISLPERQDVKNFKRFILSHIQSGTLLDIGCGLMEIPGYLDFQGLGSFELAGIDPIDDKSFKGLRIVGCSEFMPFADAQFDAVVFATSLDHTCSIRDAIKEAHRVLAPGGKVLVWMSDPPALKFMDRIRAPLYTIIRSLMRGYRMDRFIMYPNWTVLYKPPGAVDPFHSFIENPKMVLGLMMEEQFAHIETSYISNLEVFLCLSKKI